MLLSVKSRFPNSLYRVMSSDSGYFSSNFVIIKKNLSDKFKQFCSLNPASGVAFQQVSLNDLQSATRKNSGYFAYTNGDVTNLNSLDDYELQNHDVFYFHRTSSLDELTISLGISLRNAIERSQTPYYITNVPCNNVDPFDSKLIASMRLLPLENLSFLINQYSKYSKGAIPIHIGNPGIIGINSLENPEFGDKVSKVRKYEIPVFWNDSITALEALKHASVVDKSFNSFSAIGLFDYKIEDGGHDIRIFQLNEDPYFASILSQKSQNVLNNLELLASQDPGNRGVGHLVERGELCKSALALSHSNRICIITGLPCFKEYPHYELDGPPGAFTLGSMLILLRKSVTIVVDEKCCDLLRKLISTLESKNLIAKGMNVKCMQDVGDDEFDCVVAIERTGMAKDGLHHRMSGKLIEDIGDVKLCDDFYQKSTANPNIFTIGIGDGGNELGTGHAIERVEKYIPNGKTIACVVQSNFSVFAGVSNWAGYALAQCVYALNKDPVHSHYVNKGKLFDFSGIKQISADTEREVLEICKEYGLRDPKQMPENVLSVDGVGFEDFQEKLINDMYVE